MSENDRNEGQQADVEDLEVTEQESENVKGGKVAMQDFHFVMRNNTSSP